MPSRPREAGQPIRKPLARALCSSSSVCVGGVRNVAGLARVRWPLESEPALQSPWRRPRAMLITLCYLYLWARWGTYSAGLIRRTVRRLHRSRCSFVFCCSSPAGGSSQTLPQHLLLRRQKAAARLSEERVCLTVGNKVFLTDETQV